MAGGSLPRFTAHAHKNSDHLQNVQLRQHSQPSNQDPSGGEPVRVAKPGISRALGLASIRDQLGAMYSRNIGLLLIAGSQWFFALMNLGVKFLTGLDKPVPTLELVAVRMVITCICCLIYVFWKQVPYPVLGPPEVRGWLALRGFTGFFGLTGMYYSLQYLSLSDATAITFLSPSTIALCGFLFLHEVLAFREAMAGLFALLGVLLIARPESIFGHSSISDTAVEKGTPAQRLVAVGVALIGVLGGTGAMISLRIIGVRAHPMHSVIYFSMYCVLVSCVGSLTVVHEPWVLPTDWLWMFGLLGIGVSGFAGQVLLALGLQKETASRGSIGLYVQVIYSAILEKIFFHNTPPILSIAGTCMIMASACYVAITKQSAASLNASMSGADPLAPSPPAAVLISVDHNFDYVPQAESSAVPLHSPSPSSRMSFLGRMSHGVSPYTALPTHDDTELDNAETTYPPTPRPRPGLRARSPRLDTNGIPPRGSKNAADGVGGNEEHG